MSARKPIHFSNRSADMSCRNTISPIRLPSIITGDAASMSGVARRSMNHCGTPCGLCSPSFGDGAGPASKAWNWISEEVSKEWTKASSVRRGLSDVRSVSLSAAAMAAVERRLGSFSAANWSVANIWSSTPARISAARKLAPSGRNSCVLNESRCPVGRSKSPGYGHLKLPHLMIAVSAAEQQ
ncbi:hypothetical protein ACVIU7_001480 [Bradyrhizobium liaoningense]